MNEQFLKYYIENQLYLQNPPMDIEEFVKFCKKRGINISIGELELYEKEGFFYPVFRTKNEYYNNRYHKYIFDIYGKTDLNNALKNGRIYIPSKDIFENFENYTERGKGYKISSYYSTFQIHNLKYIKENFNYLKKNYKYLKENFNLNLEDKLTDILMSIQIYSPYGRTNKRFINIKYDNKLWYNQLKTFKLEELFEINDFNINNLANSYVNLCRELSSYLGNDDMIQIFKHINWEKKNKFEGSIRLGIEYLQWVLMLKVCIEDYLDRDIFDIDECDLYDGEYILENVPANEKCRTTRGMRNKNYLNPLNKNYEFDLNKHKLFYLSNKLDLDYHPRVLIIVEGKTEEIIMPKLFDFCGYKLENCMVDIINIEGISKLMSSKINLKNENKKYSNVFINNYFQLINYFLETFQTIPFFIGDNENGILDKLKEGITFDSEKLFFYRNNWKITEYKKSLELFYSKFFEKINQEFEIETTNQIKEDLIDYFDETKNINNSFPEEWIHIWKHDFEMDNYSTKELLIAINEVCETEISMKDITELYNPHDDQKGISSINDEIKDKKLLINEKLFENLKKDYLENDNQEIAEKPIFNVIDDILDIAFTNYPPTNTRIKYINKNIIADSIINKKNIFKDNHNNSR